MDNDYELQFWPSTVTNGIIMPITTFFLYIIINPFITIGGHLFSICFSLGFVFWFLSPLYRDVFMFCVVSLFFASLYCCFSVFVASTLLCLLFLFSAVSVFVASLFILCFSALYFFCFPFFVFLRASLLLFWLIASSTTTTWRTAPAAQTARAANTKGATRATNATRTTRTARETRTTTTANCVPWGGRTAPPPCPPCSCFFFFNCVVACFRFALFGFSALV